VKQLAICLVSKWEKLLLEVLKNDVVKVVKIVAFDIKSVASTVSKEIKSFVVDLPVYLDFRFFCKCSF
jgi:hypothetical protein